MFYDWPTVEVNMSADDLTYVGLSISAAEVGGVPLRTYEGITVGMTRDEALAAGAREGIDEVEGLPEALEVGRQEVPGVTSYIDGGVGTLFMQLTLTGDRISSIETWGNDHRDI